MRKKPELLAPAGDLSAVTAAVSAGADAVYFGGKAFNARAGAGNLEISEIEEAVRLCHNHGVKTYLTLNTLVKEEEWAELKAYVAQVAQTGIDAVIVQDLGVAALVSEMCPSVQLHGSTQMAVHDADGANFLKNHGFTRVVLVRELSLEEISSIAKACDIELEVFIHGALCCSYSGRCLLSSFHGGRSGNRGQCAGACRLPYQMGGKTCYPMNLKDLCAEGDVYSLAEAGVSSFKIEGRLKGIPYIYGVTHAYRIHLDACIKAGKALPFSSEMRKELAQLYNRGDFTKGYLQNDKSDMLEPETPKHQGVYVGKVRDKRGPELVLDVNDTISAGDVLEIRTKFKPYPTVRIAGSMIYEKVLRFKTDIQVSGGEKVFRLTDAALNERMLRQAQSVSDVPVTMKARVFVGKQTSLYIENSITGKSAQAMGSIPELATGKPLSSADIEKSLSKLGGSGFCSERVEVLTDEQSFLPISVLNALRRDALNKLCENSVPIVHESSHITLSKGINDKILLSFETGEQWSSILDSGIDFSKVCLMPELALFNEKLTHQSLEKGAQIIPSLPLISRGRNIAKEEERMRRWLGMGATGFEVHHMGQVQRVKALKAELFGGWGLGAMNLKTADFLAKEGFSAFTLSVELDQEETNCFKGISGASLWVYGKIPLMVTEQCFYRQNNGCKPMAEGHYTSLTDRIGAGLSAQSVCDYCYNLLFDEASVYLGDRKINGFNKKIVFTTEDGSEVSDVLGALSENKPLPGTSRGHYNSKVI